MNKKIKILALLIKWVAVWVKLNKERCKVKMGILVAITIITTTLLRGQATITLELLKECFKMEEALIERIIAMQLIKFLESHISSSQTLVWLLIINLSFILEKVITTQTVGEGIKKTPAYETPLTKHELDKWRKEFWGKLFIWIIERSLSYSLYLYVISLYLAFSNEGAYLNITYNYKCSLW